MLVSEGGEGFPNHQSAFFLDWKFELRRLIAIDQNNRIVDRAGQADDDRLEAKTMCNGRSDQELFSRSEIFHCWRPLGRQSQSTVFSGNDAEKEKRTGEDQGWNLKAMEWVGKSCQEFDHPIRFNGKAMWFGNPSETHQRTSRNRRARLSVMESEKWN
jgi:hypothetical protein